MQTFKINKELSAICRSERTRYGFRHLATLMRNGYEITSAKACYYNRTWECYEYQTVLGDLKDRAVKNGSITAKEALTMHKKTVGANGWRKEDAEETARQFGAVAMVAKMGDVIAKTPKEANEWKQRMLKAGLSGLQMPDDWDSLPEETKTERLNKIIEELKNGKIIRKNHKQ